MNAKKWMSVFGAGLLILIAIAYAGMVLYLERQAASEIEKSVKNSHLIRELSYQDLTVSLFDRKMTFETLSVRLAVTEDPIQIDRLVLKNNTLVSGVDDRFVEITGIHVPTTHSGLRQLKPLFDEMGYDHIDARLTCHYRYDSEQKRFLLKKAGLGAVDVGYVELSLDLNGISPTGLEKAAQNPFAALNELQNTALVHAIISYSDQSFIPRALAAYSRLSKIPESQITSDLIHRIEETIKSSRVQSMKNALTALRQFVQQPNFIQIRSEPAKPVFLQHAFLTSLIQGSEVLMDIFHIQISITP